MLADNFYKWPVPAVPHKTVLCVGLELEDSAAWPSQCAPFTTRQEQGEAARFVHTIDAARHLAGRALARRLLCAAYGQKLGAEFARSPYGKPFCPEVSADFSISHSGEMVWVAICRCATVGIDVEKIRPLPDATELTSQLHPLEREALLRVPPIDLETAFYRCWTRKEAVLKAVGMGLNMPLNSFSVHTGSQKRGWITSVPASTDHNTQAKQTTDDHWTSSDIATTVGYQCSVAARAPELEVVIHLAR